MRSSQRNFFVVIVFLNIAVFAFEDNSSSAQIKTSEACSAKKAYFSKVRIDTNFAYPPAIPESGCTFWQTLTWRNENLNNYEFLPDEAFEDRQKCRQEAEQNRLRIHEIAKQLQAKGVKIVPHNYEINLSGGIKKEFLNTLEKRTWFLKNKLYEMIKLMPWLDGYMITLTEAHISAGNPEEFRAYAKAVWAGIKQANDEDGKNRILMLRSWLSNPSDIARVKEYFPLTTDKEDIKNIYIISKEQFGDSYIGLPTDALIGNVGGHPQIVSFDVTVCEYRGFGWYPCGMAHEWSARFRELAGIPEPGVVGLFSLVKDIMEAEKTTGGFKNHKPLEWVAASWGRDEPLLWSPWNHLNAYTYYALANDPFKDPRRIYIDWATENYGVQTAEPLADILTISYDVMREAIGPSHSTYLRAGPLWQYSPLEIVLEVGHAAVPNYSMRYPDVTKGMVSEWESALNKTLALCDKMIEILEKNKEKFKPDDYKSIHDDLVGYKKYAEAKKVCMVGTLRYCYLLGLQGAERNAQVDAIEKLVKRGVELYESPGDFLAKKGKTESQSYMHVVRELQTVVKAERSGKPARIFPEIVAEKIGPLSCPPKGIACVGNNLYILTDNKIYKISFKGEELAVSKELAFDARALTDDGQGRLLICSKDAVYQMGTDFDTAAPVIWRKLPAEITQPDAVSYDVNNGSLFIGDNNLRSIVQLDANGQIAAFAAVPSFKEPRPEVTEKKIRGMTFYKGYLYAVESYSSPPFDEGVFKLRKYGIEPLPDQTPGKTRIISVDDWHLGLKFHPKDVGLAEDVCFDVSGNAWFINQSDYLSRVELSKGTTYPKNYIHKVIP
ncbi:MAG: hypothetical protein PHF37_01440 [Phycisphaerae bacterium]|nr:hypothetical protein [Phycisphaerae bacterium]